MKITIWTFASDTRHNGTQSSVHATEAEAYQSFVQTIFPDDGDCGPDSVIKLFDEAVGSDDFSVLDEYLQDERDVMDTFEINSHDIEVPDPKPTPAQEMALLEAYFPYIGTNEQFSGSECIDRLNEWWKNVGGEFADDVYECQNCAEEFAEDDLITPIPDLEQRVAPGEPMPAGECPECGALCHKKD